MKHKTSYSCESAIYFNLDTDIIKENYNIKFYFNKTDITPTVLDGGNEIVLANWPNDKHIICNVNNDIPVKISSHPYVLVNRSVLCDCSIEADNHYLLESIAACDNSFCKLPGCISQSHCITPISRDRTTYEQTLPLNLSISGFDKSLLHVPTNPKDFIKAMLRTKKILI